MLGRRRGNVIVPCGPGGFFAREARETQRGLKNPKSASEGKDDTSWQDNWNPLAGYYKESMKEVAGLHETPDDTQ